MIYDFLYEKNYRWIINLTNIIYIYFKYTAECLFKININALPVF